MKDCQETFCTPLKSVKIGRALLETSNCVGKFIENTLKIDYNGRNFNIVEKGNNFLPRESVVRTSMTQFVFSWDTYPNVDFTKCKRVNLFEDTGSVRELNF
jgi:hypothetical protein